MNKDIFDEGFAAYADCYSEEENPYTHSTQEWRDWLSGYQAAVEQSNLCEAFAATAPQVPANNDQLATAIYCAAVQVPATKAKKFDSAHVHKMWETVRRHNSTIPSDVLNEMNNVLIAACTSREKTE